MDVSGVFQGDIHTFFPTFSLFYGWALSFDLVQEMFRFWKWKTGNYPKKVCVEALETSKNTDLNQKNLVWNPLTDGNHVSQVWIGANPYFLRLKRPTVKVVCQRGGGQKIFPRGSGVVVRAEFFLAWFKGDIICYFQWIIIPMAQIFWGGLKLLRGYGQKFFKGGS